MTNGTGRLLGRTLLPAIADVNTITGFAVEGVAHPPSEQGLELGVDAPGNLPANRERARLLPPRVPCDGCQRRRAHRCHRGAGRTEGHGDHPFVHHALRPDVPEVPDRWGDTFLAERSTGAYCDEDFNAGATTPPDAGTSADAGGVTDASTIDRSDAGDSSTGDTSTMADGGDAGRADGGGGVARAGAVARSPGRAPVEHPAGWTAATLAGLAVASRRRRRGH